jgi:hypothetical protein
MSCNRVDEVSTILLLKNSGSNGLVFTRGHKSQCIFDIGIFGGQINRREWKIAGSVK